MAARNVRHEAFGIDFGTTNSVIAVASNGGVVPLLVDGKPHPSVVWFNPDGVTVGVRAKSNMNANVGRMGHHFERSVKRVLGKDRYLDVRGERIHAADVAAEVFKHLRQDAIRRGHQPNVAVITVPIGFDGLARADIRRAAAQAGIAVTTFVHEPFAAVLGYYKQTGRSIAELRDETIVVFDWGGGTLDITVARTADGRIEEVATGGLTDVAGDLFDDRLRKWAEAQFIQAHGLTPEQFDPEPGAKDRIALQAELAKIELSSRSESSISVARVLATGGHFLDMNVPVSRVTFEELIAPEIQLAMHELDAVLDRAGLSRSDVATVLLIGGSAEIPRLKDEFAKRFGTRAHSVANSQSIIAEGAAVVAFEQYEPFLSASIEVALADGSHYVVFARGERVPTTSDRSLHFYCTDNRDGEARLILRERLATKADRGPRSLTVMPVPVSAELPKPYNHERVRAVLRVDENLVLQLEAAGATQGKIATASVYDLKFGLRTR